MGKATNPRAPRKSRKSRKPSEPRKIAAAVEPVAANDTNADTVNQRLRQSRAEAARIKAQGGEVNIDAEGNITGAWRMDVFAMLRTRRRKPEQRGTLGEPCLSAQAYEAYRGHERDLHLSAGAVNPDRRPDFIRSTVEGAPGQMLTTEQLDAGTRVRLTLRGLSGPDARLLNDLMSGPNALPKHWRGTVQRNTGETGEDGQAVVIRRLGENLHFARTVAMAKVKEAANDRQERVASYLAQEA